MYVTSKHNMKILIVPAQQKMMFQHAKIDHWCWYKSGQGACAVGAKIGYEDGSGDGGGELIVCEISECNTYVDTCRG